MCGGATVSRSLEDVRNVRDARNDDGCGYALTATWTLQHEKWKWAHQLERGKEATVKAGVEFYIYLK